MPNLAATLRDEIRRLARKEVKAETSATRQSVRKYRSEIAKLKRQLRDQERKIASLQSQQKKQGAAPPAEDEPLQNVRFSARSVKAQRKRLKLSAEEYGKLIGVTAQTIYLWERGSTRPQRAQLEALVAARAFGRREALARLEELAAAKPRPARATRKKKSK